MRRKVDSFFNMFTSIKRIIHYGWKNFFSNTGLSVATIFVMVMTISLIASLLLLKKSADYLIVAFQEKADISVFFKETTLEGDVLKVKEELTKIPEVKDVEYVSKEKALERFIQTHKDEPNIMKSLTIFDNPLPAHLNIRALQAAQYETIVNFLNTSQFGNLIEEVDYYKRKPVIERVFSITSYINKAGMVSSVVLVMLAILVVFNTIRLAIYNSREEISVMRLVGASDWFIRGPFLIQGTIAGVLAALIALLITGGACYYLAPKIETLFAGLNMFSYFKSSFWNLVLIQLTAGIGIGIVSSMIATRKYLKV